MGNSSRYPAIDLNTEEETKGGGRGGKVRYWNWQEQEDGGEPRHRLKPRMAQVSIYQK